MQHAQRLLGQTARSVAVVGVSGGAVWALGWVAGVEAATVAACVITLTAAALFGDGDERATS